MSPIDMPARDAPPEAWVVFLTHQVAALQAHVKTADATEAQISSHLQRQVQEQIETMRRSFREEVERFRLDAMRFRTIRDHTVKVRALKVNAKGLDLDAQIDTAMTVTRH